MESHKILKDSINRVGAISVASDLGVSASMLYKWCEPSGAPNASGTPNPLDRVDRFCKATGETAPVEWLCEQNGGFFTRNPDIAPTDSTFQMVDETRRIVREFSELLDAITTSLNDDQNLTPSETERIRSEWEDLKRVGEGFVSLCEQIKNN